MSRSGYTDDCDGWDLIRWRGAVASAIRGKRGQQFLKEMLAALDAMPEKRLVANELNTADGDVCAMGAVGMSRGLDLSAVDPDEPDDVAKAFGLSRAMVQEIAFQNDEAVWLFDKPNAEKRWQIMRDWCAAQIIKELH